MSELDQVPFSPVSFTWISTTVMTVLGIFTIVACSILLTSSTSNVYIHEPIVESVLNSTPLIDGHNDLPYLINLFNLTLSSFNLKDDLTTIEPWASSNSSHTDIPRLRKGGVGAQFWSAYVACDFQYKNALQATLRQIDLIKRLMTIYPDDFEFVTSADEIEAAFQNGKIGGLIGVEGGHSIDSSLEVLRLFYELGVRYLTLTHSCNTPWADSCSSVRLESNGLSHFGQVLITEMNRLGMLIDLSHVAHETMRVALNVSKAPVIFSHSCAYTLCNNSRNVPDDVLELVAMNGGIIMVNFFSDHVNCEETSTLSDVADHIDYIKNVAGEDHVGIGGDYNGVERVPVGLEDVSTYPYLLDELVRRGWSQLSLEKLVGKNILRVLRGAEALRDKWKSERVPAAEMIIPFTEISKRSNCSLNF